MTINHKLNKMFMLYKIWLVVYTFKYITKQHVNLCKIALNPYGSKIKNCRFINCGHKIS